jgi:branched-chain amino acid transport system permease protein
MAQLPRFLRFMESEKGMSKGPFSGYLIWTILVLILISVIALATGRGAVFNDILQILLFASMALSYDYFSGFTGYYNLGFSAFVALGAYVFVISTNHGFNVVAGFLIAGTVSAIFAAGVSYPFLRLRGAYFAIATLALVILLGTIDTNLFLYTGGTIGLPVDVATGDYQIPLFISALAFLIITIVVHYVLSISRLGLALKSMREDEDVTESYGVNTFRTKQIAMVVSAFFGGMSGCLFSIYLEFINSTNIFGLGFGLFPVVAAIAGGTGIFLGPIIGSFILSGLNAVVPEIIAAVNPTLIFGPLVIVGVLLVLIGLFVPGGILRMRALQKYAYLNPDRRFKRGGGATKSSHSTQTEKPATKKE